MKMVRRQLEQIVINPSELREMAFMDFVRTAYEAGLVPEVAPFKIYRELRNITSHTYDENQAEKIITVMDDFLRDIKFILNELRQRNRVE